MILSIILSLTFVVLGFLHLYWALGGTFGFAASLPTKATGERVLNPTKIDSSLIAFGLMVFGVFYILKADLIHFNQPAWVLKYGGFIISGVFFLRAIGEFRYVGFFKKVKHTVFGKLDTKYFSPLCLAIAIIGLSIELIK
jgi:hypothetical protein